MLAAARDRVRSAAGIGGSGSCSAQKRQPVCQEDAAALCPSSSYDATTPGSAGYLYSQYQCRQQPQCGYLAAAASPYGGFAPQPRLAAPPIYGDLAASSAIAASGAKAAGAPDDSGEDADEATENGKVSPAATCRLLCCYLILLLVGAAFGMISNELHWTSLADEMHPMLESVESWLHSPRPTASGEHMCADGLFVPGPARTGANTLLFFALLLWAFLGVAIIADIFMAGIEKITSQETTKTVRRRRARMPRHRTFPRIDATRASLVTAVSACAGRAAFGRGEQLHAAREEGGGRAHGASVARLAWPARVRAAALAQCSPGVRAHTPSLRRCGDTPSPCGTRRSPI